MEVLARTDKGKAPWADFSPCCGVTLILRFHLIPVLGGLEPSLYRNLHTSCWEVSECL